MSHVLELIAGGGETLKIAFATQREFLKEQGVDVLSIDVTTLRGPDRQKFAKSLRDAEVEPRAVLLRGIEYLPTVTKAFYKAPIFIDHCTPCEIGKTSPLAPYLDKQVNRVYCYSERSESELRQAGIGRVKTVSGPAIPTERLPSSANGCPRVAFLDTCSKSRMVLARVLKVRKAQGWEFEAVSPIKNSGSLQVDSNLEAAEAADFIVASYEDRDFGQPHEGGILALSVGKPMTTARTLAFSIMGFPAKNFIASEKHLLGTYSAAVGTYLRNPDRYDEWVKGSGPNPYDLPNDLLSRMP